MSVTYLANKSSIHVGTIDTVKHTYARELILEKNLERLVTYHFEIPMTCEFQKCKNQNQGTSSCEVSVPQFFGHKIKISPILPKLVPNNTYGVPKLPIKL